MNRRQELCRDFQRGNCRYGARCKYLHQLPQQQQRQQKNEFGGGGNYYSALANNANYSNQRQPQNQSQPTKDHRCNDPRICKEQIKEDFANDRPSFWRLTCYAHYKLLPNDIVGDVSPEELRALAYEGAKQGLSLKDVAQREASMVATKSAEFDTLLRSPYRGPATQNSSGIQPSPFATSPFLTPPPKTSTYMPFGPAANLTTSSPLQVFAQPPFEVTPANSFPFDDVLLGRPPTNLSNQKPSPFGQPTNLFQQSPFASPAPAPSPALQSPFPNLQGPNTAMTTNLFQSPFASPLATATQATLPFNQSSPGFPSSSGSPANFHTQGISPVPNISASVRQTSPTTPPLPALPMKSQHDEIWFKDVWKIGEIPEGEPPPEVRF